MKQRINKFIHTKSLLIALSIVALFFQSVQINLLSNPHNNVHHHRLIKTITHGFNNGINSTVNNDTVNDTVFSKKSLNIKSSTVLKTDNKSNLCHNLCVHTVCCNAINLILPVGNKIYIHSIDKVLDFLNVYHLYTFNFISVIYKPNWF